MYVDIKLAKFTAKHRFENVKDKMNTHEQTCHKFEKMSCKQGLVVNFEHMM